MENTLPLVTIITPTYNRAPYLDETIQSVLKQGYPNLEYIVLDDGSQDNTRQVLQKYEGHIYWKSHQNMGEALTVNKGFTIARGEIVCVVNSDDPLLPGAIHAAVKLLQEKPEVLAVYPDWNEIGPNSEVIRRVRLPEYNLFNMLTEFSVGMGPGTFIRRQAIDRVGMRDPYFKYAGDLEYWFRLAINGELGHIAKPLATHRTHKESASISARGSRMAKEIVDLVQKIFKHPKLPCEVRKLKSKMFARAHYKAILYCGQDHIAVIKHSLMSLWYNPPEYLRHLLLKGLKYGWDKWKDLRRRLQKDVRPQRGLKFAFVSHALPPNWSGQAVTIKRILERMDTSLYCLISQVNKNSNDVQHNFIGKLGGKYYHLRKEFHIPWSKQTNMMNWINVLLAILIRSWRIGRILKSERCSAIVAGTGDIIDLPASYMASSLRGVPFFPYLFDDYTNQWRDPISQNISRLLEPTMFREATGIIVPNEFLRTEIQDRYGIVPSVVHNPCEGPGPPSNAKSHRSDQQEIKIVYTGAIYDLNFDAFHNLLKAVSQPDLLQASIHLYTSQPIDWLINNKICGDHVVYHEHVPASKVREVHASADLLFLPLTFDASRSDIVRTSAPSKLADYLASGTPILAHVPSDSYISWYLKRHHCGLVVDQNDPLLLAKNIQLVMRDATLAQQLTNNARTRARIDFDPIENGKRFLNILVKR